jgi:hypothetical protein
MPIPRFRYGGYMTDTAGGTNTSASSGYGGGGGGGGGDGGGGGGGGGGGSSNNSPGHPNTANYYYPTYNSAINPNITGVGTNVSNITGNIIDTKAEEEANEANYLNTVVSNPSNNAGGIFDDFTYEDLQDYNDNIAYNQSLQDQQDMQQSVETAYGLTALTPEQEQERNQNILAAIAAGQNITSQAGIDQGISQIQNLTNAQIQQLIDSGFVAAESEGILGGTMGAELVTNKLKEQLANATNQEDFQAALDSLNALNAGIGGKDATKTQYNMGLLNPDQSAVYSFGDVESDPYLYKAYQDMASKNITPNKYKSYMHNIGTFGHRPTNFNRGSGGGGGYGGYGGGGGDGGGGYYYNAGMQGQPRQRGRVGPGSLQEQVNQAFLSGGKPFAKGGIVSLVED